ncbi:MAG: electron transporter RnfG [Acidobacteria bacterium]|nr:MAG: electron transporter RnfG [Acidobacteriota bacterium]
MNQTPQFSNFKMIRALGGVGILCGLLIVFTYQQTLPIIKKKKAIALENAIYKVLSGSTSRVTFQVMDNGDLKKIDGEGEGAKRVFAGLNDQGELVGFAIEAHGNGFQDVIKILYGYDPAKQAIVGFHVLESKETPGLGDKIEKNEPFLANFKALDVSLASSGKELQNPIELVKSGKKTNPWQIDAITGATISSKAVSQILGKSAADWVPELQAHLETVKDQVQ